MTGTHVASVEAVEPDELVEVARANVETRQLLKNALVRHGVVPPQAAVERFESAVAEYRSETATGEASTDTLGALIVALVAWNKAARDAMAGVQS